MKKTKKLIIGNWKMNPACLLDAKKIGSDVRKVMKTVKKTGVVLCPPYIYLPALSNITSTSLFLGAQDAFYESGGAYTGEVSFSLLPQFKVSHCIVGHSERRERGESDEVINKKVRAIVGEGMTAVVCVGEKKEKIPHGDYLSFVREQIFSATKDISKKLFEHLVIAYEPVWAIGASEAMSTRDIHEMSIYIKKVLREIFGVQADGIKILYGGAVNIENAETIVRDSFVSGILVGRESLNSKNFIEIIKSIDKIK